MAQFPISMVSGGVPSEIPYGRASAAAFAAPSIAVGNMGETLGSISDQMVEAEKKVQAARDTLKMNEVLATFRAEGDILAESPNTSLSAQENRLNHAKVMAPRLTELIKAAGITDPTLEKTLRAHAVGELSRQGIVSWKNTTTKQIGEMHASTIAQIRSLAEQGTPDAIRNGTDLLRGLTEAGVLSAEQESSYLEYLRSHATTNAAAAATSADPYSAAEAIASGKGIFKNFSESERKASADHARSEGDRLQVQGEQYQATIHASALAEVKQMEKLQEQRWGQNEVELINTFLDSPDTDPRVIIQAARRGDIKPNFTDVNQLMGSLRQIKSQANDKDDPDTLTDVDRRVYDVRGPQIGSQELLGLRTSHLISDGTYRRALQVLKADADMRRTEGDKAKTEQTQIRMGAYSSGKQVIDDWFTTVGTIASSDKEQITVLKGQALNQFWDLTKGGRLAGVDPTEALPYVMNQFRSVGVGVARTLINEVPAQYRDPKALKKAFESGRLKDAEYRRYRTYLVNANDIVPMADWESMNTPVTMEPPKPSTPKPTTGGRRAPTP